MTSGDGTAGALRLCKNPACGREFTPAPQRSNTQPQLYCRAGCRSSAERERRKARDAAAPEPAERPCAVCGTGYRSPHPLQQACGPECSSVLRKRAQTAIYTAHRAAIDKSAARPKITPPRACPACDALVARDSTLAYCSARCGWSVLLTASAAARTYAAAEPAGHGTTSTNTDDSDDDQEDEMDEEYDDETEEEEPEAEEEEAEEETEEEEEEEDEEAEAEEEEAPAPKPARKAKAKPAPRAKKRQRAAQASCDLVLHAIRCGHHTPPTLMQATKQKRTGLFRALRDLVERGLVRKDGTYRATYHLVDEEPAAPVAQPPAPVRNASVTPAPASLRAQIAALPPGELLDLIDALAPVAAHARALAAALAGLRGAR